MDALDVVVAQQQHLEAAHNPHRRLQLRQVLQVFSLRRALFLCT